MRGEYVIFECYLFQSDGTNSDRSYLSVAGRDIKGRIIFVKDAEVER